MRKLLVAMLLFAVTANARADVIMDLVDGIFGTGKVDMPISTVMTRCDIGTNVDNFSYYKTCIINTYSAEGNHPNSPEIKALYLEFDLIDENYQKGNISNTQAKAYAYRAWQAGIGTSNQINLQQSQANEAARWEAIRKMNDPGQWNQKAPPSPFSSYRIDGRTYNCTDIGGHVNCR